MNLGLLKLELFTHGARSGAGLPTPLANPFGLVHLVLPGEIAVSIHLIGEGEESPFTLVREGEDFFLAGSQEKIPVCWTPPLRSYQRKTSSGLLVSDILTVHGGLIAVHPSHPCRFGQSGLTCRYCGSSRELSQHPPFTPRDLVEAVQIVLKEKRCDIVHLSSGRVDTDDGGVEMLSPWVAEIRKHLNVLISLDLVPPATNEWIDRTYAMGVDALYFDTDFFDPKDERPQDFHEHRRRQLAALRYAAKIFPTGAVLSHLVIGFEPLKETQKRITLLIEQGVVPVLVYFPPNNGSDLASSTSGSERRVAGSDLKSRWTVTPEDTLPLYTQLYEELVKTRINPHWVQQYDVVLTPLEGRFFSNQSPRYHLTLKNFYETWLGRVVRFGLASLRRHLRVREVPAP